MNIINANPGDEGHFLVLSDGRTQRVYELVIAKVEVKARLQEIKSPFREVVLKRIVRK